MKKTFHLLLTAAVVLLSVPARAIEQAPALRTRTSFDSGWLFQKGDAPNAGDTLSYAKTKDAVIASSAGFLANEKPAEVPRDLGKTVAWTQPDFDDSAWRKLDLPHDWGIEGPFDQALPGDTGKLPWQGVGWYRKHFKVAESAKGRCTFIDFDGAMAYATVWCNGQFVGGWPYGYTSFQLDLTPFVKPGADNVLAVRLDNPPASSRWYPGAGIYRHVWLTETNPVHVAHWGVMIKTPEVSVDRATVDARVTLAGAADKPFVVLTDIYESDVHGHPTGQRVNRTAIGSAGGVFVEHPKLWDLEHPNLYVAATRVEDAGHVVVDRVETVFGIRKVEFNGDQCFLLNGKRVPLQGVCNHHDLGALGTAVNDTALERQVRMLKEMGCNAIRTSHNPPTPELLDICDRLGVLVMDETFDCWKVGKNPNDYGKLFPDWHEKDLRALVRRDRNHPSVILWSVGNEVPDQGTKEGPAIAAELTRIAHEEDGGDALSRRTTAACNHTQSGYNGIQKGIDVMGFNYKPNEYPKFHASAPNQPVISTESSSCISTRGFYVFPVSNDKKEGKADFQMSSYDLYAPPWATPPDWEFKGQDQAAPYTGGEFVWTGFDYIGEPTPYDSDTTNLLNFTDPAEKEKMAAQLKEIGKLKVPSRSSYFGIIDLAGFPKDRYYIYQARWRPDFPMAHLLPHWTWPDRVGEVTPVHVYTSGDEAELFLNGQSLGRKKRGEFEYRLRWDDVKYAPGEVKVVAYKGGKEWATDSVKTAGNAAALALKAERNEVTADGCDLAFVCATVTDDKGIAAPRTSNLVKFSVSGPAEIVATDNGDATSHASFQAKEIRAFNGKCLAIVRTKAGQKGAITVTAEADGLKKAEVQVTSK